MTGLTIEIPTLETERLVLRGPMPRDYPAFREFYSSPRARFVGGPLDERGAWRHFATQIGHWAMRGFGMWIVAAKQDDTAIGLVGCWYPGDWPEPELGWVLFAGAEGKGLGFEAARAARDCAFDRFGWDTAVSYIDPANARSITLAERLGARLDPAAVPPAHAPDCAVYRHPAPGGAA